MIKFLSWTIVFCIAFYILGTIILAFTNAYLLPYFIGSVFFIGIASSLGLIITLIVERIKDGKEEKDDLSKY